MMQPLMPRNHFSRQLCGRQVGDVVWLAPPGGSQLVQDIVTAVETVQAEGMFNPYTNEGPFVLSFLRDIAQLCWGRCIIRWGGWSNQQVSCGIP